VPTLYEGMIFVNWSLQFLKDRGSLIFKFSFSKSCISNIVLLFITKIFRNCIRYEFSFLNYVSAILLEDLRALLLT
jgi:hypothetical protein